MMTGYGCRFGVALIIAHFPLIAMDLNNAQLNRLRDDVYAVVIGLNDQQDKWYRWGIKYLKRNTTNLSKLSFNQLQVKPYTEKHLLKCLVIKKEKELLSIFLDMYNRSHPGARDGINFNYKIEKKDEQITEIIDYTLLDVAFASYCQALEKRESGQAEKDILALLVDRGGELKLYSDRKNAGIQSKKRYWQTDDQQELLAEEPKAFLPLPARLISVDVGPLLDIQEVQNVQAIELESGALITFNLDDYQ